MSRNKNRVEKGIEEEGEGKVVMGSGSYTRVAVLKKTICQSHQNRMGSHYAHRSPLSSRCTPSSLVPMSAGRPLNGESGIEGDRSSIPGACSIEEAIAGSRGQLGERNEERVTLRSCWLLDAGSCMLLAPCSVGTCTPLS